MLRAFGPGLPGDSISHRYGFDGNEPVNIEWLSSQSKYASLGVRSAFAMSTWYEEIDGGYYENRALFVLIDGALRSLGIVPVQREYFREQGLVPVEGEGQLFEDEDYVLVLPDQTLCGHLKIWMYHAGGGGSFYEDNMIFDFILPRPITENFVDAVEAACGKHGVRFARVPDATPPPPKLWWSRWWSRLAR